MFAKNRRISILAFLIAPFLMLGDANGFTELPASTFPATATETATTTTLASSNAPATLANVADIENGEEALNETSATAGMTTGTRPSTTRTRTTTMIPKLKHENGEVTFVVASETLENTADMRQTAPSSNIATKSFSVTGEEAVAKEEEKDMSAERKKANMENEDNGNAAVEIQIKYAKEQIEPATETTKTVTQTNEGHEVELATPQVKPVPQEENASNALNVINDDENSRRQSAKEDTEETERPTSGAATKATPTPQSAVHVERQLKNGLYRIKLAEIVTDEFNGSGASDAYDTVPPSTMQTTVTTNLPLEGTQHIMQHQQQHATVHHAGGGMSKINIVDLYPMKIEDFNPIIRDSNARLLKERTIFTREDADEHRQNLMPNEVEVEQDAIANGADERRVANGISATTANIFPEAAKYQSPSSSLLIPDSVSDFTGKLLAEQDGVITEIEQKFRLNEFAVADATAAATTKATADEHSTKSTKDFTKRTTEAVAAGATSSKLHLNVNHKTLAAYGFIDRRVKKSFDFPMHRAASDAISLPHVDFANTKFNTDTSARGAKDAGMLSAVSGSKLAVVASHPEFSTTKFYNSKELQSELLQHNRQKLLQQQQQQLLSTTTKIIATTTPATTKATTVATNAGSRFQGLNNQKFQVTEIKDSTDPNDLAATSASGRATVKPTTSTLSAPLSTVAQVFSTTTHAPAPLFRATETTVLRQPKKYQKELKRAKLLLKTIIPATTKTTTTKTTTAATMTPVASSIATNLKQVHAQIAPQLLDEALGHTVTTTTTVATPLVASTTTTTTSSGANILSTTATTGTSMTSQRPASAIVALTTDDTTVSSLPERRATNPTKSSSKPIARPRILSRLQEKINSLECEVQSVPPESNLWRGNETHELMLPAMLPEICKTGVDDCSPLVISWEGEAEIQSGDILIVEINDTRLIASDHNKTNSAHTTQVYQVTRSGHEHCDVTEGILLDITPLVVDGRKLVTLYDKDLTEGVNLLIVVSELWGSQCIRLKVTTKTDNCGENADCSGKGVCLSNTAMEEYECQCCSGFAGPHCEEIDACTPSPCTNNGICVDLSQGHEGNSYQCLCPYGYTGKNCQYEADPCNPAECMNGGSCVGNSTHFRCDCTPGFAGPLCQHSLNECESSPCVHGICVDQEDGFRCFCQPGFAGELCNFEYNECESNPCQNGNECIDHIGRYECRCTKGYTGSRCQFKVDLCENRPCPEGHRCIDHGNDFSCECPGGQNGPDCNQMTRTQCNVNPCTHGGTCWSSGDSFYCACRPGYTGTMCEDEFVVETVISSSEFMVDDTSARNFNEKTFGSSVVLKSPIELHNAYFAAGVLAAAIFIVAIVVTICHCKVNQTYRKFSTRSTTFFPILGFGRRPKSQNKLNKHWLSGKGLGNGNPLRSSSTRGHLPATNGNQYTTTGSTALQQQQQQNLAGQQAGQLHERPFQRHLAMNLENDMYYTVDFSENSQHSPLIQ